MKARNIKLDLSTIILSNESFKPYFKDILEWLEKQPLLLLSEEPEITIKYDRLSIKFKCLGESGIYYEPFSFHIRETQDAFLVSNCLDTIFPSLVSYDVFTFPLIVQGEIKIQKF